MRQWLRNWLGIEKPSVTADRIGRLAALVAARMFRTQFNSGDTGGHLGTLERRVDKLEHKMAALCDELNCDIVVDMVRTPPQYTVIYK